MAYLPAVVVVIIGFIPDANVAPTRSPLQARETAMRYRGEENDDRRSFERALAPLRARRLVAPQFGDQQAAQSASAAARAGRQSLRFVIDGGKPCPELAPASMTIIPGTLLVPAVN
jgi:hypothetical protein